MEKVVEICSRTSRGGIKCKGKLSDWWNDRTIEAIREQNGAWRVWWRSLRRGDRGASKEDVYLTKKWQRMRKTG